MWLVLDKGFVSVVEHRDDPSRLLVRARVAEDILGIFGDDVEIVENPTADYLYRAVVSRERFADTVMAAVQALDYPSHFKDVAIERSAPVAGRPEAYYGTWTAMSRMQPTRPYGGEW